MTGDLCSRGNRENGGQAASVHSLMLTTGEMDGKGKT